MKTNVGYIDRVVRVVLGAAMLGAGYSFKTWWGLVGLLPLLTGLAGFCPAYLPFGWNTCSLRRPPPE